MIAELYMSNPFWVWMAVAGLFLAAEVVSGTGWLLWPAGAAAVVALLTFLLPQSLPLEVTIWAALTLASSLAGRRFLPRDVGTGPDINDNFARLVGKQGTAVSVFDHGQGRVFIDGKEWAAVADGDIPALDQRVEVVAAEGAVLKVKPA